MPTDDDLEAKKAGLCARCLHVKRVDSARGSTFWMCTEPSLPKYPRLPVVRCGRFGARPAVLPRAE